MNFLKLREGLLLVNAAAIASLEGSWMKLTDGSCYHLSSDDVKTVLDAILPVKPKTPAEMEAHKRQVKK